MPTLANDRRHQSKVCPPVGSIEKALKCEALFKYSATSKVEVLETSTGDFVDLWRFSVVKYLQYAKKKKKKSVLFNEEGLRN